MQLRVNSNFGNLLLSAPYLTTTAHYLHLRSDRLRQLPGLLELLPVPPAQNGVADTAGVVAPPVPPWVQAEGQP